jgi:hypothetical protein
MHGRWAMAQKAKAHEAPDIGIGITTLHHVLTKIMSGDALYDCPRHSIFSVPFSLV